MPSYEDLQTQIAQYEATSGRKVSSGALRALYEADLKAKYAQVGETAKIGLLNRELTMKEKEAKAQASAAKMSGAIQLGGLGIQGYGMYKYFNPTKTPVTAPLATEIPSHVPGLLTAQSGAAGPLNIPAATTPSLTGIPSLTPLPTAVTPAATTAATAATPSLLSTAGWAGGVGAGVGMGARALGANKELSVAAGAATGAAYGFMTGGPVGGIIGLVAGALPNLFDKVICTELFRQGYLSRKIHRLDEKYAKMYIDNDTLRGYHVWAKPLVCLMSKSRVITYLVYPIGRAWAHEMAHRVDPKIKGSVLGKILHTIGVPVCRFIGHRIKINRTKKRRDGNGRFIRISR